MEIRKNSAYHSNCKLNHNYLHFILELYSGISYFIGTNTRNTRRVSRKIVKEKLIIKAIYRGGGRFFIKNFCIKYNLIT